MLQAGNGVLTSGPQKGKKEELLKAADHLASLVDTTVGLIPGPQEDVHSLQFEGLPQKDGGAAANLTQSAAVKGQDLPEEQLDLAKGIDRARMDPHSLFHHKRSSLPLLTPRPFLSFSFSQARG